MYDIKVLRICIFSTFANGKKEAVYLRNMYTFKKGENLSFSFLWLRL